jgi:hypothetical protein
VLIEDDTGEITPHPPLRVDLSLKGRGDQR